MTRSIPGFRRAINSVLLRQGLQKLYLEGPRILRAAPRVVCDGVDADKARHEHPQTGGPISVGSNSSPTRTGTINYINVPFY